MFCTECGASNEEDALFCNECGARIVGGVQLARAAEENGTGNAGTAGMPQMRICPNKHEYDPKQYPSCPYCTGKLPLSKATTAPKAPVPNAPAANIPAAPNTPAADNIPAAPEAPAAVSTPPAAEKTLPVSVTPVVSNTVPAAQPEKEEDFGKDPVAGWIVCTKGEGRGRDYRILAKNNRIGNSAASEICLKSNAAVDRDNYATIAYYAKQNAFYLIPGDGRGGLKLNGDDLEIPTEIHAKDVIGIGSCEYRFVSFCADDFRWED